MFFLLRFMVVACSDLSCFHIFVVKTFFFLFFFGSNIPDAKGTSMCTEGRTGQN